MKITVNGLSYLRATMSKLQTVADYAIIKISSLAPRVLNCLSEI